VSLRKRPCQICSRWFTPHPRAGDRQRVCSAPACQRERHRRADRDWHARHPDYDKKRRLQESAGLPAQEEAEGDPLEQLDWEVIERAIGPKPRVVVEGVGRLLLRHAQDAVPPISKEGSGLAGQQLNVCSQDAVPARSIEERAQALRLPLDERKTQSAHGARGP